MSDLFQNSTEVDQLLLNAELKQQIEPYMDESVTIVNTNRMPTRVENAFLTSMLEWERAPILPISEWFEPRLDLPAPQKLTELQLSEVLNTVILMLFEKGIVLEYTEHLSDRELYCLIIRDILPSEEKRVLLPGRFMRWQCIDARADEELWLQYYATEEEREDWAELHHAVPPAKLNLPFKRYVPRAS